MNDKKRVCRNCKKVIYYGLFCSNTCAGEWHREIKKKEKAK